MPKLLLGKSPSRYEMYGTIDSARKPLKIRLHDDRVLTLEHATVGPASPARPDEYNVHGWGHFGDNKKSTKFYAGKFSTATGICELAILSEQDRQLLFAFYTHLPEVGKEVWVDIPAAEQYAKRSNRQSYVAVRAMAALWPRNDIRNLSEEVRALVRFEDRGFEIELRGLVSYLGTGEKLFGIGKSSTAFFQEWLQHIDNTTDPDLIAPA